MLESQLENSNFQKPKSYEKNLQSNEPFIRMMYEDLENRIGEFEQDVIENNEKTGLKEFLSITVVMAVITVAVFLI